MSSLLALVIEISRYICLPLPDLMNIFNLLLVLCLVTAASTGGVCLPQQELLLQNRHYSIENYNADNGLPQNSVKDIAADSDGYIWIGTESGLVRYDGSHFKTYDKSVIPISNNSFPLIQRSVDGDGEKLVAINQKHEFVVIKNGSAKFDPGYYNHYIKPLYPGKPDWVAFAGGNTSLSDAQARSNEIINVEAQKGNYFYAHGDTVDYYLAGKKNGSARLTYGKIWSLFRIDQSLYLPQDDGTFSKLFSNQQTRFELDGDITKNTGFKPGIKNFQILWNNNANQVFIRLNNAFYLVDKIENNRFHTFLVSEGFDLLLDDFVKFYYHKKAAIFFAGSFTKGLFLIRKKLFQTFEPPKGLDPVFYGQTAFGKESVLTGQGNLLGPNDNSVISPIHNIGTTTRSIIADSYGAIWFPHADSLFRYDRKQKKVNRIWGLKDRITVVCLLDSTRILVGIKNKGIYLIDPSKPEVAPKPFASGPFIKDIICILKKDAQNVLVGTEQGLFQINTASAVASLIPGTAKLHIQSLHGSKSGELWMAVKDEGIFLFNDKMLTKFPLDRDERLLSAHCMIEDRNGYFWIPTNKGLMQVGKGDLLNYSKKKSSDIFYMYYGKSRGFASNEFNGGCLPCAVRLPNDYISLPSLQGLVWFVPELITPDLPENGIHLDRLDSDGVSQNIDQKTISFSAGPRQLRFYLSSAYFGEKQNLQWSYAITDKSTLALTWVPIKSTDAIITIGNPKYGSTDLRVRKASGFGVDNFTYKVINIWIEPFFYETLWFKLSLFLTLLLIGYLLFRMNLRSIKNKNIMLERRIDERTHDLKLAMQDIDKSRNALARQMQIQSKLVASMSHDIITPLKFISSSAGKISQRIQLQKYEHVKETGESIHHTAQRMVIQLANLIGYVKTKTKENDIPLGVVNLNKVVKDKFDLFEAMSEEHLNLFSNLVPPELEVISNQQMLSIIIHNLIDNAVKSSSKKLVSAYVKTNVDAIHLVIEDQGPGMPEDLAGWLSVSYDTLANEFPSPIYHKGMGLIIIRDLAMFLKIGIAVEIENGTKVSLIFKQEGV
jgi:signal transduction histidine kinase